MGLGKEQCSSADRTGKREELRQRLFWMTYIRTAVLVSQLKNGRRVDLDKGMALVLGTELPRFIRLPDCQTARLPDWPGSIACPRAVSAPQPDRSVGSVTGAFEHPWLASLASKVDSGHGPARTLDWNTMDRIKFSSWRQGRTLVEP